MGGAKPLPVMPSPAKSAALAGQADPDPLPPVAHSLPVRLIRAREALMTRIRPVLRAHGLTEQQWRVLCTVRDLGEIEITILAERAFLLPPSLSRIVRDLEARGLLARRSSVQDQRRALVSVTPAGATLVERVEPSLIEMRLQMRRAVGLSRLKALGDLLDEIEACLGAPSRPSRED
jgi:homoprotocatechuate degradation regulator HpaR